MGQNFHKTIVSHYLGGKRFHNPLPGREKFSRLINFFRWVRADRPDTQTGITGNLSDLVVINTCMPTLLGPYTVGTPA